ncbi:MAG: hypothetical protein WCC38_07815 [Pseudonocardiaceae bacterium]
MTLGEMGYGFGVSGSTSWYHKHGTAGFGHVLGCTAEDLGIVARLCLVSGSLVSTFRRLPSRLG